MKILYPTLLFFTFISINYGFAQSFKKGYIVNAQKDTIYGYIKETTDKALAHKVYFSLDSTGSHVTTYITSELSSFGFSNGRTFENFLLKEFTGRDTIKDSFFAKRIITGKINAFIIQPEKNGTEWLLKNQATGKIVHLTKPNEQQEETADGHTVVVTDHKYLQYIALIKQDSSAAFVKQDNFTYSEKEIIRTIKKYDLMYKDHYPFHQYHEQKQITYGVLAGVPVLHFVGVSSFYRLNMYRDLTLIEKVLKISLTQSMVYSHYKVYNRRSAGIHIFSIFPIGLKFQPPPMPVLPYFYIGLGVRFMSQPVFDADHNVVERITFPLLGLNIGTGVKIKVTSKWFIVSEVTLSVVEGGFVNAGISYQFIKQQK